jgi:hypothetical protein
LSSSFSGKRKRPSFNPKAICDGCKKPGHFLEDCDKVCCFCKEHGHLIDACLKRCWVNEQSFSKREQIDENGNDKIALPSEKHEYSPSFERPSRR